jgi:hypothetical protein
MVGSEVVWEEAAVSKIHYPHLKERLKKAA